jgi:putative tryptophan/tyrosine transport system substrate-binding protein
VGLVDAGRRAVRSRAGALAAGGLAVATLALLTRCVLPPAPPPPVPRIGVLESRGDDAAAFLEPLRQGLREQGYVDGRNVVLEEPPALGADAPLAMLAAALVESRVDVIVAIGSAAAEAAKAATARIPIVAVGLTSDPVGTGLVASLGRPGGNLTGLRVDLPELSSKQLELVTEALPGTRRVAVLANAAHPAHASVLRQLEATARLLDVELQVYEVRTPDDFAPAFAAAVAQRADALLTLHDPLLFGHRERLLPLAARSGLPTAYEFREWVDAGGLLSYGPSLPDAYRRAALYVDRILRGAPPADLPIEQPTRFELVINLRTAAALGRTIPRAVLDDAKDVIR